MKNVYCIILSTGFLSMASCSNGSSGASAKGVLDSLVPDTVSVQTTQNTAVTYDLNPSSTKYPSATVEIVTAPQKGSVTFDGTNFNYEPDAYETGADSFEYRIVAGSVTSSPAEVNVQIDPLTSGTFSFTENYSGGDYDLTGWESYSSSYGHATAPAYSFVTSTFNAVAADVRRIDVTVTSMSYGGNTLYNSLFSVLPVDGAGGAMNDWTWAADLIKIPSCFHEVEMVAKIKYITSAPLVNLLLNYRVQTQNSTQYLTGYQLLVNAGGNSVTLAKFEEAHERAMSYIDRWPRHPSEGSANPVRYGPYNGWNRRTGNFPAGANVNGGQGDVLVAVRYAYDPNTSNTQISFEVRSDAGVDSTPGTWDEVVNLTGSDSLAPGGGFGFMPVTYHNSSGFKVDSSAGLAQMALSCVVP